MITIISSSILVSFLCLLPVVTATGDDGRCSYDYEINCQGGTPYVATTSVTLATASSSSGGEAYVTFHWGGNHADSNVGSILRPNNSPQTFMESHSYYQEGDYYAGVSILFGTGSGCEGVELHGYQLLKFDDLDCEVNNLESTLEDDDSLALTTSTSIAAMNQEGDVATTAPPPLISTSFSTCSFQYEIDCDNTIPYSATAWVTFDNPNYEASVTFHWGLDDNAIGSRMYTPSQPDVVDSFTYTNEGDYYVGYTVVFGDRSGCEGMTFQGYKWVWYDDRSKSCDVVDDESVSTTTSTPIITTSTAASLPAPVSTPAAIESTAITTTATSTRSCAYDYEVTCNNPHSAMAYVTFVNPSYEASITFHWDTANTVIDSRYYSNTQPSMANSYDFGTEGVYNVGVTIVFGEGYGCDDVVYESFHTISFDGLSCQVTESNDESQGTSTANDVAQEVATTTINAPTMLSGTELLGEAVSDWMGTNAPTMTSSASNVASGVNVTSPIPSPSFSAPISSITTLPATNTKQESSSPSMTLGTTTTPAAGPTGSMIPTYLLTTEKETSSPSTTPRTGTAPLPVSKNMLTSSGVNGLSLSWFMTTIYSIGIVVYILH